MKVGVVVLAACVGVVGGGVRVWGQSVPVPKTNPTKVYVHMQPWFQTPGSLGGTLGGNSWGWHWTMNNQNPNVIGGNGQRQIASYYYPATGPYDSSDGDVIEYQLLLMKLSGIDGVIIDWYGQQGSNGDVGSLLSASNAIVNKTGTFGLKFGVCMEDQFARSIADPVANVTYLKNNYFNKSNYIRTAGNKPLMMVFGPQKYQTPGDWTTIMAGAGEAVDLRTLWYESGEAGANADGEFAWIYQDAGTSNHLSHQQNFLQVRSTQVSRATGMAYAGFRDFYAAGGAGSGIGFTIPANGVGTLQATLGLLTANSTKVDTVQLATWNDYGEGTMLEPTVETGYTYLQQIQSFTGTPYGVAELSLVTSLYNGRKALAGQAAAKAQLDAMSGALNRLDFTAAKVDLKAAYVATLPTYARVGSGGYDVSGSWSNVAAGTWPNGVGATAIFSNSITSNAVVTLGSSVTLGRADFISTFGYELAGTGALKMQVSSGKGQVNVNFGGQKIGVPVNFASSTDVTVDSGATLALTKPAVIGAGVTVGKLGMGTLTLAGPVSGGGGGGGGISVGAGTVQFGTGKTTSVLSVLSITSGAGVDLVDNAVVVKGGDLAALRAAAVSGLGGGVGLFSSGASVGGYTTVGVMKNNGGSGGGAFYSSYGGVSGLTGNDVIARFTYAGDTNLDGVVDGVDLGNVIEGISSGRTGWEWGDVNYDGVVNGVDVGRVVAALGANLVALGIPSGGGGEGGGAVPEPGVGLVAGAMVMAGLRRRR